MPDDHGAACDTISVVGEAGGVRHEAEAVFDGVLRNSDGSQRTKNTFPPTRMPTLETRAITTKAPRRWGITPTALTLGATAPHALACAGETCLRRFVCTIQ